MRDGHHASQRFTSGSTASSLAHGSDSCILPAGVAIGGGVVGAPTTRYAAFISYSHRDARAARALHRRLESYRIPRRLVGEAGEYGPVAARLSPIFRDREELPAAGDLSARVRAALAASDSLVVLCSPHAAGSMWIAREIEMFRALNPERPILAAVVAGEPTLCFPKALLGGGAGKLAAAEPLAADLRSQGDGRRMGFLKLVAGIAGVGLDALVQRDAARQIRRVTAVTLVAVAAMLTMAALTIAALNARRDTEHQRVKAEGLVEFMLTDLREKLKQAGRLELLTDANRKALAYYDGDRALARSARSRAMRARILHAMGEDDLMRGDRDAAASMLGEAFAITQPLLARAPNDPETIFLHAQSQYWLGQLAEQRGDLETARAAYMAYRVQAGRMAQLAPAKAKYIGELGYSESSLGSLSLRGFKRPNEARAHFESALTYFDSAAKSEAQNDVWLGAAANAHAWIADTWFNEKRFAEARRHRLAEQTLKQRLYERNRGDLPKRYALVITGRALARVDMAEAEHHKAEETLLGARRTMQLFLDFDDRNEIWRNQAVRVESDLADLYATVGRREEASQALERAGELLHSGGEGRHDKDTAQSSVDRDRLEKRISEIGSRLNW